MRQAGQSEETGKKMKIDEAIKAPGSTK